MVLTGSSVDWTQSREQSVNLKKCKQRLRKLKWKQKKKKKKHKKEQNIQELWVNYKGYNGKEKDKQKEYLMQYDREFHKIPRQIPSQIQKLREHQPK